MTQPKYKIGDKVWWIDEVGIKEGNMVDFFILDEQEVWIRYKVNTKSVLYIIRKLSKLFPSKEELLASL